MTAHSLGGVVALLLSKQVLLHHAQGLLQLLNLVARLNHHLRAVALQLLHSAAMETRLLVSNTPHLHYITAMTYVYRGYQHTE